MHSKKIIVPRNGEYRYVEWTLSSRNGVERDAHANVFPQYSDPQDVATT